MAVAIAAPRPARLHAERSFYLLASGTILAFILAGFRQFLLHGRQPDGTPLTAAIRPLVITHGLLMLLWIVLFVLQNALIVGGNRKLHITLGGAGAVLAALMVAVGLAMAWASARFDPAGSQPWGVAAFLTVPLATILGFGAFAALGVFYRRLPKLHRPMMLLATLSLAGAGLDRISAISDPITTATHNSLFAALYLAPLTLGALFLLAKWAMTRSWDWVFAFGYAALAAFFALSAVVASTAWWNHLAGLMLR
ncbi:MAG TPA: hypothetical protein VMV31_02685 [Terriglobales bacterium]|nr:hypothetical protein [Terriglobales bacterium]